MHNWDACRSNRARVVDNLHPIDRGCYQWLHKGYTQPQPLYCLILIMECFLSLNVTRSPFLLYLHKATWINAWYSIMSSRDQLYLEVRKNLKPEIRKHIRNHERLGFEAEQETPLCRIAGRVSRTLWQHGKKWFTRLWIYRRNHEVCCQHIIIEKYWWDDIEQTNKRMGELKDGQDIVKRRCILWMVCEVFGDER